MTTPCNSALPVSWEECRQRGWTQLDILLVTGDAYIDHPSFGIALIGRLLASHGYRVAILAQPRYDSSADFGKFPAPKLFCGITAGNVDSIVANYSGNGRIRHTDSFSPDGNPWRGGQQSKKERRRPDRASLVYTGLAKSVFGDTPIILGGIEASLRRFVHYDYKQDKLRSSILTDAKADLLVYGMGEKAVIEVAERCLRREDLSHIRGTCERIPDKKLAIRFPDFDGKNSKNFLVLPSLDDIGADTSRFLEAEIAMDRNSRARSGRIVLQRQQSHWVVQHPAPSPLTTGELDRLYSLPFSRRPHPPSLNIPAFEMIKNSVTIVRGCAGNCAFCAITRHQGPAVISRSKQSIYEECKDISRSPGFGGTITDLGGPTANLFGTECSLSSCRKRDCLYPSVCPHLRIDEDLFLDLLADISAIPEVKNLFISSGLRMGLLLRTPRLLRRIIEKHTPGSLKIAPEHTDDEILQLMHKEPHDLLKQFVRECRAIRPAGGAKTLQLTPYVITAHPGSSPKHAQKLVRDMQKLGLPLRQFQDFTPTPGTLSTAMYVTGLRPDGRKPLTVPRKQSERAAERKIVENYSRRYGCKRKTAKKDK